MDRATELELLDELLGLRDAKSAFLDETVTTSPVTRYLCRDQFDREQRDVFRALPVIAAHRSEIAEPGDFLSRKIAGLPLLLTRDDDGAVHAFLNVCRHRGTRLVEEEAGCRRRFSCPYHAWTWDNRGELKGIPHGKQGFPDIDKGSLGLRRLACREQYGFVWVHAGPAGEIDIDDWLAGLAPDLAALGTDRMRIAHTEEQERGVNWKILVEGGIEAYHFRVAHRDTIGPHFQDNLSSYRMFGPHMRSVLAKSELTELPEQPREGWSIRACTNLLYSFFPSSQLLLMEDHVAWVHLEPLAADRTRIRLSTLVPDTAAAADMAEHWRTNHAITTRTLTEDFVIGESIQSGLDTGANDHLHFGRFEGALEKFNKVVDRYVAAG